MPRNNEQGRGKQENLKDKRKNVSTHEEYDQLSKESEKVRTKKPGSQGNSGSGRHNNGRGGGK